MSPYEASSHVNNYAYSGKLLLLYIYSATVLIIFLVGDFMGIKNSNVIGIQCTYQDNYEDRGLGISLTYSVEIVVSSFQLGPDQSYGTERNKIYCGRQIHNLNYLANI